MRTIYKYPIPLCDTSYIELPQNAQVLTVGVQYGDLYLWAAVDPEEPLRKWKFSVYGTGRQIPDNPGKYLGTVQLNGGAFVFHVFQCSE